MVPHQTTWSNQHLHRLHWSNHLSQTQPTDQGQISDLRLLGTGHRGELLGRVVGLVAPRLRGRSYSLLFPPSHTSLSLLRLLHLPGLHQPISINPSCHHSWTLWSSLLGLLQTFPTVGQLPALVGAKHPDIGNRDSVLLQIPTLTLSLLP